jgi:GH25 family lysozyme M1 (1,4-beta-N-acetylmuramidase)
MSQIKIVDLYSVNAPLSIDKLVLDGYRGVIFKAGQGEWPDVPRVQPTWWNDAKLAGLERGWYWLGDARIRPSLQFEALKKSTNLDFGELGMWIDAEKPYRMVDKGDKIYWAMPYSGFDALYDLMYYIQQTGVSRFAEHLPGFYTNPNFWSIISNRMSIGAQEWFARAPLWTAQYYWHWTEKSKPTLYGAWKKWTLWQHREGPDDNLFNGTVEEFIAFFGLEVQPMPIPIPVPVPATIVEITVRMSDGRVEMVYP